MQLRSFYFAIAAVLVFTGCSEDQRSTDISSIPSEVQFLNLHSDLQIEPERALDVRHQQLYQTYGAFWNDYTEAILQIGDGHDPATLLEVDRFLVYPDTEASAAAIDEVHSPQIDTYTAAIDKAFRRYRFHFPSEPLPTVVYFNGGFNYGVYPTDTHLGIGLEFFLGAEHPISMQLDPQLFPAYIRKRMEPHFLISDALRGWLLVHYQDRYYQEKDLLTTCIYWGKIMYILDVMLPDETDANKMGYSEEEQAWCMANERNLWIEFSQQPILYETRRFEINRWTADAPFTRAAKLPQNTPPRVGVWLAWRIVRDYMEKNPDTTLDQLLSESDYLRMLNAYRPG